MQTGCQAAEIFGFRISDFGFFPIHEGMRLAIYPGSFDPITNGHMDVIARAAALFDNVVVAAAINDAKRGLFSMEERIAMIREATGRFPNVKVAALEGLLVEFARREGAVAVVRGLRAVSDFEFEFQMALMNRKLEPAIETVFLTPREEYTYISSRIVKEIARLGGAVDAFVPAPVVEALRKKLRNAG
jgi:pantetheine-phosphate adenylyltransferase